jgi:protein gp37
VNGKRRIFNGKSTAAPDWHLQWTWPLTWPGAKHPKLGSGKPSLIFVGDMSDLFHEDRPKEIIDRICATMAQSDHIGLLLTKRAMRMREYFSASPPRTIQRWRRSLWLGFSAEDQEWFDHRWTNMRPLASAEWFVLLASRL